jgi:hypothetical protein
MFLFKITVEADRDVYDNENFKHCNKFKFYITTRYKILTKSLKFSKLLASYNIIFLFYFLKINHFFHYFSLPTVIHNVSYRNRI